MLKPAYKYQSEINDKLDTMFGNEKFKYYFSAGYYDTLRFEQGNWYKESKVSVNKENNVIGFIQAEYNRYNHSIKHLQLVNFSDESNSKLLFGKDVYTFFKILFKQYNIKKINFSVCVGNPIEKSYDKLTEKLKGRIVGTYKDEYILWDNKLYDAKEYEIMNPFLKIQ